MKSVLLTLALVFLAVSPVLGVDRIEGELLIKMKGNPNAVKSNAFIGNTSSKLTLKATYGRLGMHYMRLKPGQKMDDVLNELRQNPDIEYAEPNYILRLVDTPSESQKFSLSEGEELMAQSWQSYSYNQSGNSQVKVTEAWDYMSQNLTQKPIIAVIDTGVDYLHPVFTSKNAIWENSAEKNGTPGVDNDGNGYIDDIYGWNFAEGNSNPMDSDASDVRSHGTHVAGIILGVTQPLNSTENSRIQIMSLKFLGTGGTGSTSAAIQSIYYAVNNGARIINMSWGGSAYSQALHDALAYAYDHGVLLIAAAGNAAKNNDHSSMYPANFPVPSQMTVAAVNDFDDLAGFSNFGQNRVQISAPGVSIYSTAVGGYRILSGTSMAAPFVAGLAAMVMAEKPNMTGYQVKNLLLNSSDSVNTLMSKVSEGSRAQALNSLLSAQNSVNSFATQPAYKAVQPHDARSPASTLEPTNMGGCGLVSTSVMSQWKQGGGNGPTPSVAWLLGFSLLPLIIWQSLRVKAKVVDFSNRRRFERFTMDSEIKVKVGDRELIGQMSTISAGGLSFKADTLLEKGGLITLQIASPDGSEQLEVQGRVVWNEQNQAYGVQFSEEKAEIRSWSKHLSKAS